jgi:hypothetical protein
MLVFAGLLAAAPAAAGTITVGWDLMTEANVTGYRVYVGTRSGSYSQTFDVPADKDFFIFRNAFLGVRYYFAVAAQFDATAYGPRSLEVSSVGTRSVAAMPDGARVSSNNVLADCVVDCVVVKDLARGAGDISSLAVTPDGTVLAVQDGRRVVAIRDGVVSTAFEAAGGTLLRDIAIDPQFASSGRVFISLVRPLDRANGEIELLRLRLLAGALGEPATIVSGPPVPLSASVPFAVGDDGLLYLAIPALISRHPYSSALLAFDEDGRLPAGQGSPIVARGLDEPLDMAWDAQTRTVWLIGRNGGSDVQVLSLSRTGAAVNLMTVDAAEAAPALAVMTGAARRLLVAMGVDLLQVAPGTSDSVRISLDGYGTPVAVAALGAVRYVATRPDGAAASYRVLTVEDGAGGTTR